jgi:hypothetical protein
MAGLFLTTSTALYLKSTAIRFFNSSKKVIPENVIVDLVQSVDGGLNYEFKEKLDFASILKENSKAVLFAVPGLF